MRWIAIALLLTGLAACEESRKTPPPAGANAEPEPATGTMPRVKTASAWRAKTEPIMVDMFCAPEQFFRQCFDLDEALCRATASETIKRCFNATDIPDPIDQPTAKRIGTRVGECAGSAYEQAMVAKRKHGGKCDDVSAWVPK